MKFLKILLLLIASISCENENCEKIFECGFDEKFEKLRNKAKNLLNQVKILQISNEILKNFESSVDRGRTLLREETEFEEVDESSEEDLKSKEIQER